ncbi:MAG: type II toxin-antitoxin system HicA family toxin [Moorellales bacterium]
MPPRFRELKAYCEKNGWVLIRQTDHYYYEKVLADGTVLRTRVSMALHKEIPRHLWKRILSHQLRVTEEEFWRGLD